MSKSLFSSDDDEYFIPPGQGSPTSTLPGKEHSSSAAEGTSDSLFSTIFPDAKSPNEDLNEDLLNKSSTSAASDNIAGCSTSKPSKHIRKNTGKLRGFNLFRLSRQLIDDDSTLKFCQDIGLLAKSVLCPTCKCSLNRVYKVKESKRRRIRCKFQCNKRKCRGKGKKNVVPLRKGSWFEHSKVSLRKSLLLAYCFINKLPYKRAVHEISVTSADSDTDNQNIKHYYNEHRDRFRSLFILPGSMFVVC